MLVYSNSRGKRYPCRAAPYIMRVLSSKVLRNWIMNKLHYQVMRWLYTLISARISRAIPSGLMTAWKLGMSVRRRGLRLMRLCISVRRAVSFSGGSTAVRIRRFRRSNRKRYIGR